MKRRQTRAPAWFNTTESHSWGWVQRFSLESIMDLGCCESRAGRRQYHKQKARCWGCEQRARSSAWVNLNGGSTREEFGDPELSAHTSPPPALYTSSWPRNKDSKHPQTPTMLCSAHFPTARRQRIVTKMKMKKRCREEKIENTIRWWESSSQSH